MQDKEHFKEIPRKDIQFLVNEGIIYSKRDIMSLVWDLGFILYYETENNKVVNKGKGFIMRVSANNEDPTLFLNGRIYINVSSFNYMKVKKLKESMTLYELHSDERVIKIIPDNKKQMVPPFRYFADSMVGMGVLGEEEVPPDTGEDNSETYPDENIF